MKRLRIYFLKFCDWGFEENEEKCKWLVGGELDVSVWEGGKPGGLTVRRRLDNLPHYSILRAVMGSTAAARQAGITEASRAANASDTVARPSMTGS